MLQIYVLDICIRCNDVLVKYFYIVNNENKNSAASKDCCGEEFLDAKVIYISKITPKMYSMYRFCNHCSKNCDAKQR